ncbi:hypothetical protein [Devosia submarina]|uniref:hypothetical protein n=1 Tax=Devosia submarina TaxID=1173082 RepID=UPI0013002213|nr:hypothetical protein [Devosia submarina]
MIIIDSLIEKVIRPSHYVRLDGANRLSAQFLPAQQRSQFLADRPLHLRRLSCSASSDGSKTIGKAFADGQNLFARGSKND